MQNSSNYLLVLPLLLYTSGITKPTVAGVGIPSMNVDSGCSSDGTQCDSPEDATSDITTSWHWNMTLSSIAVPWLGASTLCSKNYLFCHSPMLLNVAYYAIDSYPLFHIMLIKNLMKFIIQHKIHAFKVHSYSSQAIQYNCTTELPRM